MAAARGPCACLRPVAAGITMLLMTLVRTLLAVWLTLAVPAAGVAVVSAAPDCADHDGAAAAHTDHAGHATHADGHDPGSPAPANHCDCDCEGLHCASGTGLSIPASLLFHAAPAAGRLAASGTPGMPSALPDEPFRPPISL